jgi:hypothetical protein
MKRTVLRRHLLLPKKVTETIIIINTNAFIVKARAAMNHPRVAQTTMAQMITKESKLATNCGQNQSHYTRDCHYKVPPYR